MPPFQPQAFGKYFLVDKIAMGGMAEIFLAKPQSIQDPRGYLVIKRILPHFTGNTQFVDMFIDEAKISSQLSHVNIVPLYDLGKINENYFLAMEYVPGQDLKGVVKRCTDRGVRLSYEHAAFIMREACLGLEYAHTKTDPAGRPLNIVHRDISPQNILVGYDGQVKITDFGIAKASSKLDSTQVGTLKGKFGYMAPEQVMAGVTLDHRADIFAAGVILWELVTGQRLFSGTNEIEILERVRAARIEPPSNLDPDVPKELERIVFYSLMRDRDKRYQTAKEMANDLSRFLAHASPRFGAADMNSVMGELFEAEIDTIKQKWNVTIGPVIDRSHAVEGADLESTLAREAEDENRTTVGSVDPERKSKSGRMEMPPPAPPPPERKSKSGRMLMPEPEPEQTSTARVEIPTKADRTSPRQEPAPKKERSSVVDLLAEVDAEQGTQRRDLADELEPEAPREKTKPGASRSRGGFKRRAAIWSGILSISTCAGSGSLMYTGAIRNPFAPPALEVYAGVDATISVDGVVVLVSGRKGRWPVGAGERTVRVEANGYLPFETTVEARKGDTAIVDAILKPSPDATSEILIETNPPGAEVYVDGSEDLEGVTPVTLSQKLGDHTIRLKRTSYADTVLAVRATRPGKAETLKVDLTPTIASLYVNSDPPGALVFLDGARIGPTPVTVPGLLPQKAVVVEAFLKGYRRESRTVTPPGGEKPFSVEIALIKDGVPVPVPTTAPTDGNPIGPAPRAIDPTRGALTVFVPSGVAEVWLDGVRIAARTPLTAFEAAPGQHTLRVFDPVSGREHTETIVLAAGQELKRRIPLD